MKILVTGAKGFIGKNLIAELNNKNYNDILEFDMDTDPGLLDEYCKEADFVFHLAGVNRPKNKSEFMDVNFGLTSNILDILKKYQNTCPVMISSSIQAEFDNPYGESKKAVENALFNYNKETRAKVLVYRFPNVFGKWCLPNYNSAVATFCYNIANDIPIKITDPDVVMTLIYVDDLVEEMIFALNGNENANGVFCEVPIKYTITLGEIVDLINSFKISRLDLSIPNMADGFTKKFYSTYLSYLPTDNFHYNLKTNRDSRGSFTEFIKTPDRGQISINISAPGITKGNHWHQSKNEKFMVVSGKGVIRFRKVGTNKVLEYYVSGDQKRVVDIPTGYVHNITNLGKNDLITVMWANESFDSKNSDTIYMKV